MELRRATGTRVVEPPVRRSPQISGDYLIAHACFACRKSWRLKPGTLPTCKECGAPLSEMGRSFRAPRKTAAEQWEKVRALWDAGFRFWSYRSFPDAEPLPERLREVADFIRRNPDHPMRLREYRRRR